MGIQEDRKAAVDKIAAEYRALRDLVRECRLYGMSNKQIAFDLNISESSVRALLILGE